MYFARIKLIMAKLYRIIEPLYANNDSHIQKVQRKIRKIFDLQMEIEHAYKNPNERSIKSKKKSGQVVSRERFIGKIGENNKKIYTNSLPKGYLLLVLEDNNKNQLGKTTIINN